MRNLLVPAAVLMLVLPNDGRTQQPAPSAREALIKEAMSAAPPSIAARAQVMLMDGTVLRTGTNGWTCFPDDPAVPNNSPMCVDSVWLAFFDGYMKQRPPVYTRIGVGYMLQGDMPVSNTDPFATEPTPNNQWLQEGVPHIMLLVPDPKLLDALPADPHNGGPWIMWKGTPYAHIMVPTSARLVGDDQARGSDGGARRD